MQARAASDRPAAAPASIVEFDPDALAAALGSEALALRHHLSGHPVLSLDAATALAETMPAAWAPAHRADLPLVYPAELPAVDARPADVVRGIGGNRLRTTLYHLECFAGYKVLLGACLRDVSAQASVGEGPVVGQGASLFLASPGSVVPVHFDRHHNVLLQLQGTKQLTVGTFADPRAQQRAIEMKFEGSGRNPAELPTLTRTFRLRPGDGVYIPPYTLHWAQAGDDVSVAVSCAFSTTSTVRAELVHACNAKLRRLGLRPRPPGRSVGRDRAKAAFIVKARRLRGMVRDRVR
jgi:hypothetical protein